MRTSSASSSEAARGRALLASLFETLAHVAVTTAAEGLLLVAKVPQDEIVPAAARFDVPHQVEKEAPLLLHVSGVLNAARVSPTAETDQAASKPEVPRAGEQEPVRGLPVAPCAPDLLIVRLDRARRLHVNDGSDVGPIDSHTERVGSDDHIERTIRETPIDVLAHRSRQARRDTLRHANQLWRRPLRLFRCCDGSPRRRSRRLRARRDCRAPREARVSISLRRCVELSLSTTAR